MRLRTGSAFLCLTLAACASQPPVPAASDAGSVASSVAMVDHIRGTPVMLKRVSVVACAPNVNSPTPTEAVTFPLLREKAAAIGATGILRAKSKPAGLFDGCGLLPSLKASGIAFRVEP